MVFDEYEDSSGYHKLKKRKHLKKPLRIAFLDIDSTMTGSSSTTNSTRSKLERLGYVVVYVTARTEEMLMSSTQYALSQKLGFSRPRPHLGRSNGKRLYIPPEHIEPLGVLDPDIIAGSTGTQIYIKQREGGYAQDNGFEESFGETAESWRQRAISLVHSFNTPEKKAFPALYEKPSNYSEGITDIYQPKYRIAVTFQSAKQKNAFRKFVMLTQKTDEKLRNVTLSDDSEPKKEHYALYLTPKNGSKTKAVDRIITMITEKLQVQRSDLHVLIAGDGHADFDMGMRAARGTCATFLLAGGSRLMPALRCKDQHPELLDEDLEKLKLYLNALETKGYYRSQMHAHRSMIICDEVYIGKKAAASILPLIDDLETI